MHLGFIGERKNKISKIIFKSLLECEKCKVKFFIESDLPEEDRRELYNEYKYSLPIKLAKSSYVNIKKLFKSNTKTPDNRKIASRCNVKYIVPKERSINDGLPEKMYNQPCVDHVIVGGCDQILSEKSLDLAKKKILNYHYSVLPSYRGKFSLFWQWYENADNVGFTFHQVNQKIDDGDIILQKRIDQEENIGYRELEKKLLNVTQEYVPKLIYNLINGERTKVKENIKESHYPSKKYHRLLEVNEDKSLEKVKEVIDLVGHMRLPSGFKVSRVNGFVENKKVKDITSRGVFMPLSNGTVILEPSISLSSWIIKITEGEKIFNN